MNQSAARKEATQEPGYTVMVPISPSGLTEILTRERARTTLIRVVPVICMTKNGSVTGEVLKVALVNHKKGGGYMLPQLEFIEKTTPYESVRNGMVNELQVATEQLQFVSQSTILLGTYLHNIPSKRVKHVSEVGGTTDKLFVFVKVCVDPNFQIQGRELQGWAWSTSMSSIEKAMAKMRDPQKRIAEIEAIGAATGWNNR